MALASALHADSDERKRLERWERSLGEKSAELRESEQRETQQTGELSARIAEADAENAKLKASLRRASSDASRHEGAATSISARIAVEGAVMSIELREAEEVEDAMRRTADLNRVPFHWSEPGQNGNVNTVPVEPFGVEADALRVYFSWKDAGAGDPGRRAH